MVYKSSTNLGGGGSGTVTEIDTGTGLTGGPITTTGTISVADSDPNSLAGYDNAGEFSTVAVGTGLSLAAGTLTCTVTGDVSSVSNSDGTLTISPTTGNVVASLALAHANTWTGQQTFNTSAIILGTTTASRALVTDGSKNVISSATTATEIGYVNGVTSSIQTQLDGKQAAGNYITALTGDVTASGPGSASATLATVNGNVGSFGSSTSIPSFTVNAKGLITAASGNVVIAPAGTLTGTTLASNVVTSSLTTVGTLTGGATGAGFTVALGTSTVTGTIPMANLPTSAKSKIIGFSVNNPSPSTGQQGSYSVCEFAGSITAWGFQVDAGTATVKVWKRATGTTSPTVGNVINTSGVSISSGTAIRSTTLTDFTTTSVAAGDFFAFDMTAVSGATKIFFWLEITAT